MSIKSSQLINPFSLLGINENSNLKDLKKAYYELSLLCHPDRGGNKDDMIIVHNAYKYISNQFENCKNIKDFDELETNFENFCNEQKETPPPFRDIFELSNEYLFNKKFNEKFDELKLSKLSLMRLI